MKARLSIFSLLACLSTPLLAQNHFEQSEVRFQNSPISYEAVTLFDGDSSKSALNIHYRIGQNFFIFIRNDSPKPNAEFVAHGELVVELLNDQKVSVNRQIYQLPLSRATMPREGDKPESLEGVVSFPVRPGTYTIVFSVDDHESGRTFMERTRRVTVPEPKHNGFEITETFFVHSSSSNDSTRTFVPVNRGGNVLLASTGGLLTEISHPVGMGNLAVHWKIEGKTDGFGEEIGTLQDSAFTQFDGLLQLKPQDQGLLYGLKPQGSAFNTVYIPIPLQNLDPGNYTIDLQYKLGSETKRQHEQFHVIWPSRPVSLSDPDLAIDALRHIATEGEIESMQSGSAAHRSEAFHRFWRARDHDTTTAYSEAMAEYYYRVDDTMRKFSTARENDGYKTDRGRIYILYGPPPKSERILEPNSAPSEVWTYERLHRRFIFIDVTKTGNYVLSQAENL